MSLTLVWNKYSLHFDSLSKEDRLYVASIIFLYLSRPNTPDTIESLLNGVDDFVATATDEARVCLRYIEGADLCRTSLLDIGSALLANSR